jgi:hypothetical protein
MAKLQHKSSRRAAALKAKAQMEDQTEQLAAIEVVETEEAPGVGY